MSLGEDFDIHFELKNATKEDSASLKTNLVWSLEPAGYQTNGYGFIVPAVWRFQGRYVAGFEMDNGQCIRFIDHPEQSKNAAIVVAPVLTGLAYEVDAGQR